MHTEEDGKYEVIPLKNANCVTRKQLAKIFCVQPHAITMWVKAGMPRWKDDLYYSIPRCVEWREEHIRGGKGDDRKNDAERMAKAKADLAEIARDEKRGVLVVASEVEAELTVKVRATQQAMLAIPATVAAICANQSARFIAAKLTQAITRGLQGLVDRSNEPTKKPKEKKPVGRPKGKPRMKKRAKGL